MIALSVESIDLDSASSRLERLRSDVVHFEELADILRNVAGINLVKSPKNMSLMAARLARVLDRHRIDSYEAYLRLLKTGGHHLLKEFVSAMTTNTTEFFREARHFELLTQRISAYLQERAAEDAPELRVWCAASSSGQEVYSLLITLLEAEPRLTEWNLKVLATDIDLNILDRASRAVYSEAEMAGVPPILKQKYFQKCKKGSSGSYLTSSRLRNLVTFAPFNLMSESYPFRHSFDIVFCRNVLIYFDRDTATAVTEKIAAVMQPSGFLFVGHSEVGLVRGSTFATESSAFYRKIRHEK